MRALLLGAGGMLARDLLAAAPSTSVVTALSRNDLDITDRTAVAAALDELEPDWVINSSAYRNVDGAETDYAAALAVNGAAVTALGELCASRGTAVLHYSTDYVFAGESRTPYVETDSPSPVNAYGRTKLAGEEGLAASGAHALVVRTQWLFGLQGRSFPRTMWERARANRPTRVVDDQFGRPTFTRDLARASWELMHRKASGIYHVANEGTASWFEVAAEVFERCHSPVLSPCGTADYPTPARRPAFSVLDTARVLHDHGIALPPWQTALGQLLDALEAEAASTAP